VQNKLIQAFTPASFHLQAALKNASVLLADFHQMLLRPAIIESSSPNSSCNAEWFAEAK